MENKKFDTTLDVTMLGDVNGGWIFESDYRSGPSVYQAHQDTRILQTMCVDPTWLGQQFGYSGECWISQTSNGGFVQDHQRGQYPIPYSSPYSSSDQDYSSSDQDYSSYGDYGTPY